MITTELFCPCREGDAAMYIPMPLADAERWLEVRREWAERRHETFTLIPIAACQCCGESYRVTGNGADARCARHLGRNPCAVEGCKRTRAAAPWRGSFYYRNNIYLCGEHYRLAVPPGSPQRQVLNRLFRLHRKRHGKSDQWDDDLNGRYWRVWFRIIAIARSKAAGDVDMDEINKLFGWDA